MKGNFGSNSKITTADHTAMIAALSEQALAYANKQYGPSHPIWNSIHSQIESFCGHPHGESQADEDEELNSAALDSQTDSNTSKNNGRRNH